MAGGRGKLKRGRGDGGQATRVSRRAQGLPAEEHKDLDTIVRERRARLKAEREAKKAETEDQAVIEPEAAGDVMSTAEAGTGNQRSEVKPQHISVEQSQAMETAQASVGGANEVETPAADRVSDTLLPVEEEELAEEIHVKEESSPVERSIAEDVRDALHPVPASQDPSSHDLATVPETAPTRTLSEESAHQNLNADPRSSLNVESNSELVAREPDSARGEDTSKEFIA
uniref:Uncharacterized protein n=1 Tax=Phytophthora ramorum TaxID=164328 RepID=H3H3I7_PHYRM